MISQDWTSIRRQLRGRRLALGWSQQQLATKIEVGQSMISEWETGVTVPVVTNLLIWMWALGMNMFIYPDPDGVSPWQ